MANDVEQSCTFSVIKYDFAVVDAVTVALRHRGEGRAIKADFTTMNQTEWKPSHHHQVRVMDLIF